MRLLTFFLLLFVTACDLTQPAGPDSYNFTLPDSPGGRMCAHQCLQSQDFCHQACDFDQRKCSTGVQQQALEEYNRYTLEQFQAHAPVVMTPSAFEQPGACLSSKTMCNAACDDKYQRCFANCGGTVEVTHSCRYICF